MKFKKWLFLKIFDHDKSGEKLYLSCIEQLRKISRERVINNKLLRDCIAINHLSIIKDIMETKFVLEGLRDSYINMIWSDKKFPLIRFAPERKN